jgi:hypothetical protein
MKVRICSCDRRQVGQQSSFRNCFVERLVVRLHAPLRLLVTGRHPGDHLVEVPDLPTFTDNVNVSEAIGCEENTSNSGPTGGGTKRTLQTQLPLPTDRGCSLLSNSSGKAKPPPAENRLANPVRIASR